MRETSCPLVFDSQSQQVCFLCKSNRSKGRRGNVVPLPRPQASIVSSSKVLSYSTLKIRVSSILFPLNHFARRLLHLRLHIITSMQVNPVKFFTLPCTIIIIIGLVGAKVSPLFFPKEPCGFCLHRHDRQNHCCLTHSRQRLLTDNAFVQCMTYFHIQAWPILS
jgi:hypothetical protein